jgi:hypothetical protein
MLGWESASSPTFSKEKTNGNQSPFLGAALNKRLSPKPNNPSAMDMFLIETVLNWWKLDVRLLISSSPAFFKGENE